ncbi:MAG: CZB domain-containing protein [Burkholderiales bacterium]|nr:CZB domain-containing protein [Burkholderiales bacterium]
MAPAAAALAAAIVNHRVYNMELSDGGAKEGLAIMTSAKATLWGVGIATVLLSIALGLSTLRGLLRQLGGEPGYAAAIATEIAGGNLGVAVQLKDGDRTSLLYAMKAMCDSLANVVGNVRQSADGVATASMQIAQGNQDLSSRTEEQAGALEETAASMEELGGTVKQNADNAQQANQLAQGASSVAIKGGEVVDEVVRTMKDINDRSRKIVDIIGVIDGIAFQTNILALNAAVEAARAGEQGRGFAVVASEVRTLAQRSAEAAREIKTLIGASVEQVESGTVVVRKAGDTIARIVGSSQRVDELLGEVAGGAREQSLGVAQIGQAVQDLDRMTQQNAALVEETAAAASAMKSQATALATQVARFRLPEGSQVARESAPGVVVDFDFDQAIEAHRQWKVKLRQAIAEHEKLDADKICRDDQCPLGRWIHGPGGAHWGGRPDFVELTARHARFHEAAGAVARRINQGAFADAERLIGSGSVFAQISTEVATLLTRAKRGL